MIRLAFILPLVVSLLTAQEDPGSKVSERVRALFQHKCSECHGDDLTKPKGRFGFATDLGRVATRYVKPGDADESELWWFLIGDQELMPPLKAENGPLSVEELALVRWWIESGAAAPAGVAASGVSPGVAEDPPGIVARLHVLVVHFPIALILVAVLAQVLAMRPGREEFAVAARYCLWMGALGAMASIVSGWGAGEAWSAERMFAHRWLGMAAAVTALVAAVVSAAEARGRARRSLLVVLMMLAATLVVLAGHQGGLLVHGADYFGL